MIETTTTGTRISEQGTNPTLWKFLFADDPLWYWSRLQNAVNGMEVVP